MKNSSLILAVALAATLAAQSSSSWHITHRYMLGGEGSWDYVVPDAPTHRVFIGRQDRVMVVDENDGKLLGEVTGIKGAHGTAIAAPTGHGFATSGNDESVVMFDLKTYQTLVRIPAAEAACTPLNESSNARQLAGAVPSISAARKNGSGAGLPLL